MGRARALTTAGIEDVLDLGELQVIQDTFAQIAGVASVITDPAGRPLTRPSGASAMPATEGCAPILVGDRHFANWCVAHASGEAPLPAPRRDLLCVALGRVAEIISRQALRNLELQALLEARVAAERERIRLEDHLRQAAKLAALGRLAGGIAHDFNNLLTAVHGYAELLQAELNDRPESRETLAHLFGVTNRASLMVRGLLDFARKDRRHAEPLAINDAVEAAAELLTRHLDPRIEVRRELDAQGPVVIGDAVQLTNAVLNLCLNARDAMPQGGVMTIATRTLKLDAAACRAHPNVERPGPFVEITVADTGVGMDASVREQVFEPFFTTKGAGHGTGLGMAAVYACVAAHHGGVDLASEVGAGTVVSLFLPLAADAASRAAAPEPSSLAAATPVTAHGRVLVVDDDEPVRALVAKVFARAGYDVEVAADGVAALEIWNRADASFDLVVLDLVMPRLGGQEVLAAIMAADPEARVLVMTGFSAGAPHGTLRAAGAADVLAKPFRPAVLLDAARRILADRAEPITPTSPAGRSPAP